MAQREWFAAYFVGSKSHASIEEASRIKDVVALVDFKDWKERRMPSNPDFALRNRSIFLKQYCSLLIGEIESFSEVTKEITDVALQGVKKQRDDFESALKDTSKKMEDIQAANATLHAKLAALERDIAALQEENVRLKATTKNVE